MGEFKPISTIYKSDGDKWWIKSPDGWQEIIGSDYGWKPDLEYWKEISEQEAFLEIL